MQKEIFKDILGYEGYYQVSNLGRVKSLSRLVYNKGTNLTYRIKEKILKTPTNSAGYQLVSFKKNGEKRNYNVACLVAVAFLNHKPKISKLVIDHIDNNPENNHISNLQLITQRENLSKDKFRNGKTSIFTGVSWHKQRNKWVTSIRIKNKGIHLGYFANEIEASNAYQRALQELLQ